MPNNNSSDNDLKVNISYKQIINIALPISVAIFIPQVNYFINNYFLGHYDASGELLGINGIVGVYYLMFSTMGFGLNNGLQALMSRRAGEDRIEEISKLYWNGIRVALLLATFGILVSYTLGTFMLEFSLKSPTSATKAIDFLRIRIWGLPYLLLFQISNALMIATGNSRFLLFGTLAQAFTNIFFDYVLINGFWGFPEWGFQGAAVASILMEVVGLVVVIGVLNFKGIVQRLSLYKNKGFNKKILVLIAIQSFPLVFQQMISIMSWEYFFILVERHGQILRGDNVESAIANVMRNFFGFCGCTTWALASTCNTMVSNVIGQGQKDEVLRLVRMIVMLSTGIALFFALILNLFPKTFLSVYGQSEVFLEEAVPVLRLVSVAIVLMAIGAISLNAVNGTANTKRTLLIEFVSITFYSFYIWLIFEKLIGPYIIGWYCELFYWIIIFTMAFYYLKTGKWKEKVV